MQLAIYKTMIRKEGPEMATASTYFDPKEEGNNYLHELMQNANCEDVSTLVADLRQYFDETPKDDVLKALNSQNIYGNTPILELLSCFEPRAELAILLFENGCDVNISDNLGMTPLYKITAMQYVPPRILRGEFLGEMEINIIEQQNKNLQEIMKHILRAGADTNKGDIFGRTPLFLANDTNIIHTLIAYGANIKIVDSCWRSLVHIALCMPNFKHLLRLYLSTKMYKEFIRSDKYGSTPLHYSAILKSDDVFKELLRLGADINKTDNQGNLPLTILEKRKLPSVNRPCQIGYRKIQSVHYTDVIKSNDLSFIINQGKNSEEIYNFFSQPGLGSPWDESESVLICSSVVEFAKNLCVTVGKYDERLKCSLFRSGSSAEGTKTGDPTEFDFVFCLDQFARLCRVTETTHKGFAELESVGTIPEIYKVFFDENNKCKATEIRYVFSNILKRIVLNKNMWTNEHFFFDGDVLNLTDYSKPVFTLKLRWVGCLYKDEEISIDIVPAVRQIGWWPSDTNFQKIDMMTDEIRREGCLLLLQNPYFQSDSLLRISCSPAEIFLMKSLPSYARESYKLCKLLRHKSICPMIDPDPTSDHFPLFEAEDCITSYMLKNCLFHILIDCKRANLLGYVDSAGEPERILDIAKRVLKFFNKCLKVEQLPVYFIPNREDIFRFNFVEFDQIGGQSLTNLMTFHCSRRMSFLKIMLHILGPQM